MPVLLLLLLASLQATPGDPCATHKAAIAAPAYVVSLPGSPRDTVMSAVVCLGSGGAAKVGSYHGQLFFDSTAARVLGVEKPNGGMRVENTTIAGQVNFAGADPQGFEPGQMLRVRLRVRRPGQVPALRLEMRELNSTAGASLLAPRKPGP